MNHLKAAVIFISIIGFSLTLSAQKASVETASLSLKTYKKSKERTDVRAHSLKEAKEAIDKAAENASTANDPKMWLIRAETYLKIQTDTLGEGRTSVIPDENAIETAVIAINNLYKVDEKEYYTSEATTNSIFVNIAVNAKYIADVAYNKKEYDRSIKYYSLTKSMTPYDKEDLLKRQNISANALLFNIATTEKIAGKTDDAKTHFNELVAINYNDPWIYLELYDIYLNTDKDTAKALQTVDKGRLVFDEDLNLKTQQIYIYDISGKSEELIKILSQDIEDEPYNGSNYYLRGLLYRRKKENDKAIGDFEKAVENDDQNLTAYKELGELYYEIGAEYTEQANALPLNQTDKYNEFTEKSKQSFEKAIPCFERIKDISTDPKQSGRAAQFLMQMYLKTGQMDKYNELKAEYK